jgi:hypothetical protein
MRTAQFSNRDADVPDTWKEGEEMLAQAMNAYQDRRGGNLERMSCAARVAYGLFGERFMAPDPTIALLYVLQEVCRRRGAWLDGLGRPRRGFRSTEERLALERRPLMKEANHDQRAQ